MVGVVIGIVQKSWSALAQLLSARGEKKVRWFWWTLFWCWIAGIFILSSLSSSQIRPAMLPIPAIDKILHFIAFAAGGAVLAIALHFSTTLPWRRVVALAALVVSLYGALDEYHQLYTPSRSGGDVGDWIADTLGGIAGALAVRWFYVRRQKTNHTASARD